MSGGNAVEGGDAQPLLPRGTVLMLRGKWDNSAANRINPDPDQWVVFGERGVDEMSHAWIGITYTGRVRVREDDRCPRGGQDGHRDRIAVDG